MIVVLFRSRLSAAAGQDYADTAVAMLDAARGMPGFVDFKSFRADDGERLSVVRWSDLPSMEAWRKHAGHVEAKRLGRARWYDEYHIESTEVLQRRDFTRPS
jgi:heme-degrading monooxygenase HmoA